MLFDSLSFLFFFPVITILYYLCPQKFRWLLLLVASCLFYMAFIPSYILILAFLILVDYSMGILIEKANGSKRKQYLIISILANISALFFFKYFNFFNTNVSAVAHFLHWNYSPKLLSILLPIGLSFHTFQSLSYVIEVYKKRQTAERHVGIYALYVMFYPQLVAGPIERPQHMLHQFHEEHRFSENRVAAGLGRMLLGLFKKVVIADRLAILVNIVYGNPTSYVGLPLVLATVAFAFQIYCDFSGYSDIAIGAAKVMGFELVENFNYPYLATSIQDFWRRWHMSLYSWFRDYVYIPLGGNRVHFWRRNFNILAVFAVTGLWHGANWTFIIWGLIHGFYMVGNVFTQRFSYLSRLGATFRVAGTFILVNLAWVFFRAENLQDALYILSHSTKGFGTFFHALLSGDFGSAGIYFFHQGGGLGLDTYQLVIAGLALAVLVGIEHMQRHERLATIPSWAQYSFFVFLTFAILNFGANTLVPFIYFQF